MQMHTSVVVSLLLAGALAACDTAAHNREPSPSPPARRVTRAFAVEVSGVGRPVILIPGLGCSGEVWHSTVEHVVAAGYQAHVLTLAGFAGQPALPGASLDQVRRDVVDYIRTERLDHPVLIGHSLGGFLAFWIAATAPDAVGPVVAVDGLPFAPAVMDSGVTADSVRAGATAMRSMVAKQSQAEFARQNRMFLAQMITAAADLDEVARASGRSDPAAVGGAVFDLMTTDLRPLVGAIRVPVLLIAAGDGMDPQTRARYEEQVRAVPTHRVVVAEHAKHFVMLDDRAFFFRELDAFLASAVSRN